MRQVTLTRCVLFAAVLAVCATTSPSEIGSRAQERRNDLTSLRRLAEQGDAAAQGLLGIMYEKGAGVPQDYAEAAK